MGSTKSFRAAGMALGTVLAASACASTSHGIAVLDAGSSTQPVPEVIRSNDQCADDSARYLGEFDGYSYFAARPASTPQEPLPFRGGSRRVPPALL